MASVHRVALKQCRVYLLDNLPDEPELIDHLIQGRHISTEERETIESKATRTDKLRHIIDLLEFKQPAYNTLCTLLSNNDNTSHIVVELHKAEAEAISECYLKEHYREGEATTTETEILHDIKARVPEHLLECVTSDLVKDIVRKSYPCVTFDFDESTFENLEKVPQDEMEAQGMEMDFTKKDIETWTVPEVQTWLQSVHIDPSDIGVLLKEKIDGEALANMTDEDMKGLNIALGSKIKIRKHRQQYKEATHKPGISNKGELAEASVYPQEDNSNGDEASDGCLISEETQPLQPELKSHKDSKAPDIDNLTNKQKLESLIMFDEENVVNDIYPLLFINSPTQGIDPEETKNIGGIPWKAVFDFDEKAATYSTVAENEPNKVIPDVGIFNTKLASNIKDRTKLNCIHDDIDQSLKDHLNSTYMGPLWIFANGYEIGQNKKLDVKSWKKLTQPGLLLSTLMIKYQ